MMSAAHRVDNDDNDVPLINFKMRDINYLVAFSFIEKSHCRQRDAKDVYYSPSRALSRFSMRILDFARYVVHFNFRGKVRADNSAVISTFD